MLLEEGNDSLIQVVQASHPVRHALCMIRANHAAPKELFERMEQLDIALVLNNCELRKHLESGSHFRMTVDADKETPFAVNESDDPLRFQISGMWLNVKSLRVLHNGAFPADCPLVCQILTAVVCDSEY